jgi:hypothetical protein
MICKRLHPRVIIRAETLGYGQRAILERFLENRENTKDGYRQRFFEIKQDLQTKKLWLCLTCGLALSQ